MTEKKGLYSQKMVEYIALHESGTALLPVVGLRYNTAFYHTLSYQPFVLIATLPHEEMTFNIAGK